MKKEYWRPWIYLAPLDLLGAFLAFSLAYWLRISSGMIPYLAEASFNQYLELYVYSIPVLILVFLMAGLYDRHDLFHGSIEYTQVLKGSIFFVFGVVVVSYAAHGPSPSRGWLVTTWIMCVVLISLNRFVFRRFMRRAWRAGRPLERALILGASEESKGIAERLEQSGMVEVVGFLDDFSPQGTRVWGEKGVLGPSSSYSKIAERTGATIAILVPDANSWETRREVLSQPSTHSGVELQIAPGLSDLHLVSMKVGFRGNVPLLRFRPGYITGLDAVLKFLMDYLIGFCLLVLTAPTMLALGVLLWLHGGRPVVEWFEVLGKNGRPFRTYKFRTGMASPTSYRSFRRRVPMSNETMRAGHIERFLFHTGLDKLPQLLNVIRGKMSIVGPRTVPPQAVKQYGQWLYSILAVKPGITGNWALQETRDLEQEISLTLHYVRNWNIWSDLAIIIQTGFEMLRTRFRTRL